MNEQKQPQPPVEPTPTPAPDPWRNVKDFNTNRHRDTYKNGKLTHKGTRY